MSLDVFRGATIAAMVLVNDAGGPVSYAPLEHSEWHGWTFTDLIFPFFLWIIGVAMTFSFAKRLARGESRGRIMLHVVRRAAIIFALGLFIYGFPYFDLSTIRFLGVLQRLAICDLVASAIYLTTGVRGQIAWIVFFLASYWMLMMFAPVPGYGSGHLDVERNFAHYIDGIVLKGHMYAVTKTWDPEGVVSTLPAFATALFGALTGQLLRYRRTIAEKTAWLLVMGNCLICAGLLMNVWMPINKKLWTSSFAVFMAGMATVVFAICYWLVDGNGWRRWTKPFVVFGMNAIVVYVFSEILATTLDVIKAEPATSLHGWIYQTIFLPIASPINASLLYAIAYVLICYIPAYVMYRRGWFVRF